MEKHSRTNPKLIEQLQVLHQQLSDSSKKLNAVLWTSIYIGRNFFGGKINVEIELTLRYDMISTLHYYYVTQCAGRILDPASYHQRHAYIANYK